MRRAVALFAALLLAGPVAGAAHGSPHVVTVLNNHFDPPYTEIDPGEDVTWVNRGGTHTVTSDDGDFDFTLRTGDRARHTFVRRGLFPYHCRIHGAPGSGMAGVVVVGPVLRVHDATVAEGDAGTADAIVPVTLSRPVTHAVEVGFTTVDGTATAGADYEATSGTLTIPPGADRAEIRVGIIGNTQREPARAFTVSLGAPVGAFGQRLSAVVRIVDDDDTVRFTPTDDYPTLRSALQGIRPDTTVRVLAGIHALTEPVVVDVDRIAIVGDGPASLVAPATGVETAFRVRANGVRIERVTIRQFVESGVDVRGADGFTLSGVTLDRNRLYGALVVESTRVSIRDVTVVRGNRAAIALHGCEQCDADVRGLSAELAWAGVEVIGGSSVVVRDSMFRRNANGIVLRAAPGAARPLQAGAHVFGNTIEGSGDPAASGPRSLADTVERRDLVRGAGVWIDGGWFNVVEGNHLAGNRFGITVSGLSAPSLEGRIVGNSFDGPSEWDVAWDGTGAGVCFAANTAGARALRAEPPVAEVLYPCGGRTTVGVPWPVVTARLLAG